jgi:hypothetical protein
MVRRLREGFGRQRSYVIPVGRADKIDATDANEAFGEYREINYQAALIFDRIFRAQHADNISVVKSTTS